MRFSLKMLVLFLLVCSPCVFGCSSQRSAREAERIDAESDADETGELDDAEEEEQEGAEDE